MNHAGTSGSESWRISLAVALGILVLMELALRVPTVVGWLGKPEIHYHPGVDERMEALASLQEEASVDVLFVGSSVVRTNIRPSLFDQVAADAGIDVTSFNAGLSGLTVDPARLYINNHWLESAEPALVVQAVRYGDIVDAVSAAEFDPFTTSRIEPLWIESSVLSRVEEAILRHSHLIQRAGMLAELLADPFEVFRTRTGAPIDGRGWTATALTLADRRITTDLTDIPGGAEGAVGYRQSTTGEELEAGLASLEATIESVLSSGSSYVLVNMPEHGDKFLQADDGAIRYRAYLDALSVVAERWGIEFVDVTGANPGLFRDDLLFSDFHHMSPAGAERFTQLLAQAMMDGEALRGFGP